MGKNNGVLKLDVAVHSAASPPLVGLASPLLRRFLHRDLSPLLIVILLFLAPLTFSNEKIPNFQPDCAASFSLSEKPRYIIAVDRTITLPRAASSCVASIPSVSIATLLPIPSVFSSKTSRAPPF